MFFNISHYFSPYISYISLNKQYKSGTTTSAAPLSLLLKLFKLIFYSHLREIFELISSLEEVATFRLVPMRGAEAAKKIRKGG